MSNSSVPKKHHYMAAVVLGTALTALGVSPAQAKAMAQPNLRSVDNIARYCTACWRNARLPADSWQDCIQDVLTRLIQQLQPQSWDKVFKAETGERQEFLRAIDAVKKRTQRRLKKTAYFQGEIADRSSGHDRTRQDERDAVHQAATEVLSPRQQTILKMSMEGWSVQDIANELTTTPERISDEKYKAVRKLRQHFQVA